MMAIYEKEAKQVFFGLFLFFIGLILLLFVEKNLSPILIGFGTGYVGTVLAKREK